MEQSLWKEIAKMQCTPAYVFDLDLLKERVRMMRECLGQEVKLCFAMKANPFFVDALYDMIDGYEVCSPGEFHICEHAGIPMDRIVLSGVNKEQADLSYVMGQYGSAGLYTIESELHLQILEKCASEKAITIRALIRVTSGNQFGVDEEELVSMVRNRASYPHVDIQGIQCYSGTQKKRFSKIDKELDWLDELCARIDKECQFEVRHLEYGPGFYVPYFVSDEEVDDKELLTRFSARLKEMKFAGEITLEMGRYIAAYCGYYVTSIVDQKVNKGQNYCIVDGGIHHLNYFGQAMAMKIPYMKHMDSAGKPCEEVQSSQEEERWNICGSLCTVNDVIVKQLPLHRARIGDLLVFERVGAYSVTEGIYLFLSRKLPRILTYSQEQGIEVVREERESYGWNCREGRKNS